MDQKLALEILLSGESALLTGPAGSGKTFVLNQFIRLAKHDGKHVAVTATTGIAATHLGGTTIHAWSGIGVHDYIDERFVERISKGRREIIESTDVLIIDEISMLHDYRLDMVDEICRLVRKKPDLPFGGIQLVMSGDFFQLPPINRRDLMREGSFVVNSRVWAQLAPVILYLSEQHRQEGGALLEILSAMRAGDVRRGHAEQLLERSEADPGDQEMTELYTTNIDVDRINTTRLANLGGDELVYSATFTGAANYVESLERSVLAPTELHLKRGAMVMAVRNDQAKRFVNGSLGQVVAFEPTTNYPVVQFRNGREVTMQPETWELRDGDKKRASMSQIPLRLAYAMTIHKSQGMTLDSAKIDLSRAFVAGMGYVALSRVRSIETLYLAGINRLALEVSPEARSIDDVLRASSQAANEKFAHLRAKAEKRDLSVTSVQKKKTSAGSSNWQEKIAKMRETYPNAYMPWTASQDDELKEKFQQGSGIKELSKLLGRHEGSIKMRLQKHFGEDVVS